MGAGHRVDGRAGHRVDGRAGHRVPGAGLELVVTRRSSEGERTFGSRGGWWGAGSRRRTRVGCTPWRPRRRAWTMRRPARGREEGRVSRQDAGEGRGIRGECERVPVSRARVPKMGGGRREGRAPRRESTHREDVRHGVAEKGRPRGLAHRLCRVHRARGATLPGWECAPRGRVTKRQTATRPTSARNGSTNGKIVIGPILAPTSSGGSEESPPFG